MADDEIEVVYLGEYATKGGGKGHAFLPLTQFTPETPKSECLALAGIWSDRRSFALGAVYKGKGSLEDGRIARLGVKGLRYTRLVKAPWFLEVEALMETNKLHARADTLEKKAKANAGILAEVKALGDLYAATRHSDRTALELAILRLIRRGAR